MIIMDQAAKRQLAEWLLTTIDLHEASWDKASWEYDKSWQQAAEETEVDADMVALVVAMCGSGLCDFHDWAEKMLGGDQ
jgi:hypothetical protein